MAEGGHRLARFCEDSIQERIGKTRKMEFFVGFLFRGYEGRGIRAILLADVHTIAIHIYVPIYIRAHFREEKCRCGNIIYLLEGKCVMLYVCSTIFRLCAFCKRKYAYAAYLVIQGDKTVRHFITVIFHRNRCTFHFSKRTSSALNIAIRRKSPCTSPLRTKSLTILFYLLL